MFQVGPVSAGSVRLQLGYPLFWFSRSWGLPFVLVFPFGFPWPVHGRVCLFCLLGWRCATTVAGAQYPLSRCLVCSFAPAPSFCVSPLFWFPRLCFPLVWIGGALCSDVFISASVLLGFHLFGFSRCIESGCWFSRWLVFPLGFALRCWVLVVGCSVLRFPGCPD